MEPRSRSFPRVPFLVFLLLTLGIVAAGRMIFRYETARARKATEEHLSSIADLKAVQIANWRRERLDDAESFAWNPLNSLRVRPPADVSALRESVRGVPGTIRKVGIGWNRSCASPAAWRTTSTTCSS